MEHIKRFFWLFLLALSGLWWLTDPPALATLTGLRPWRDVLMQVTGVLGIGVMSAGMVLALRPKWFEPRLGGLDKMYRLHKWLGIAGLVLAISHWVVAQGPKWLSGLGLIAPRVRSPRPEGADAAVSFLQSQRGLAEGIGEAGRAGQIFAFFAGECLRLTGEALPSVRPGVGVEITREPVGIVGMITPWNFPIAIPAWKIAPALAYGNWVVFLPADLVPGSAWALVDILQRAGLPKGVLNLVMGRGSVVGQALLQHKDVHAISFTGSVSTGRKVAEACIASSPMKKVQLEMGGKNPLVVLDDADLKTAVEAAVTGAFFSTGQRCTASSRLIVQAGIHDKFVEACIERLKGVVVDDALKAGTHIGPVVDQSQLDQDLKYIQIAKDEGGKLVWGGELLNRETPGFYLQPALFTQTTNAMRISREEVFGPVANIIRVKDYEEALSVANDTEFGLSSGICTTSLKHATHFRRNAEAGMVMVNLATAGVDYHVPFGGRKGSSYGSIFKVS